MAVGVGKEEGGTVEVGTVEGVLAVVETAEETVEGVTEGVETAEAVKA